MIEPRSPVSPALRDDSLPAEPSGKLLKSVYRRYFIAFHVFMFHKFIGYFNHFGQVCPSEVFFFFFPK